MTEYEKVYDVFFNSGEVTEIRAYGLSRQNKAWEGWAGGGGIVYGYFDNAAAFGECAAALEAAKAPGIYFVLNPVKPDLMARASNRLKAADQKTVTTSDKDVLCLRWLYIDLDPKRPTGISSSQEELEASIRLRNDMHRWAKDAWGVKKIIPAISGNGAHLMIQIQDIPNQERSVTVIKGAINYLHSKFTTDQVEVDTKVYNPARICKLYGTTARKGDSIPLRPHRKSYIEPKYFELNP
jgi:hypothetical protein